MRKSIYLSSLAVVIGLQGCAVAPAASGQHRAPFTIVAGIDTSTSDREQLSRYAAALRRIAAKMTVPGDRLYVLRIDNECREVSGPRPPSGSMRFLSTLARNARPMPSAPGTYHAIFMSRAAELAASERQRVVVLLLTDGQNDDFSPQASHEMRTATKDLVHTGQLASVVWSGVVPGWRERIRAESSRFLGGRLRFEELEDLRIENLQP